MIEFIFMLTRDDVTLSDAREVYASIAGTGGPDNFAVKRTAPQWQPPETSNIPSGLSPSPAPHKRRAPPGSEGALLGSWEIRDQRLAVIAIGAPSFAAVSKASRLPAARAIASWRQASTLF